MATSFTAGVAAVLLVLTGVVVGVANSDQSTLVHIASISGSGGVFSDADFARNSV